MGSSWRRDLDAFTALARRPIAFAPATIPARLVPSVPVWTSLRMCARLTARPKCRRRHREAGGAAVHLVHLPDVLEAPDPAARRLLCPRPLLDLLAGRSLLRLLPRDRLGCDGRLSWEQLLREVERDAGGELELVAIDVALDDAAERLALLREAAKVGLAKHQQPTVGDRLDRHRARGAEEQRPLAEEIAAADVRNVSLLALGRVPDGVQPPLLDDVHARRGIALPDDRLAFRGFHRLECVQERLERLCGKAGEGRREPQEVAPPVPLDLAVEVPSQLRMHLHERREQRAVELQRLRGATRAGPSRCEARPSEDRPRRTRLPGRAC